MELRLFEKEDLKTINLWLIQREMKPVSTSSLPEIGFVVEKGNHPVAAGFLRACEGRVGILDSLITDPKAALFTRHLAIEKIVQTITTKAKELGYTRVIAFSTDKGTVKRSQWHGFQVQPHAVLSLTLSEGILS